MVRLVALDVGEVRIGVAVSDASGFLASPYTTLRVSRDQAQIWQAIQRIVDETGAEGLVVGLPISLDGQIHTQGERVRDFAGRLREHIQVPLTFWDERFSTVEAQRLLAERTQGAYSPGKPGGRERRQGQRGKRGRQGRQHEIDALAAAVILQEYLDSSKANENKDKNI
ncbi:MAG TPA: Holliday junction resolvase RuvX [Ktedonobacteraceae bacterium]|nr:Holliday junction resolvase RuvX [Ktedonobacteraceae bacterium]